jgi:hypothetical protein
MEYILSNQNVQSLSSTYSHKKENYLTRFLTWCKAQETDRFLWLGLTFFAQIGLAVPVTACAIIFLGGNSYLLWIIMLAVNVPTLVLNLAALPTKVTLPFLFFAWFTELVIILYCVGLGLMQ